MYENYLEILLFKNAKMKTMWNAIKDPDWLSILKFDRFDYSNKKSHGNKCKFSLTTTI